MTIHHLETIAAQLQAAAINHKVWVGDIEALVKLIADKIPGVEHHDIVRAAHSREMQQELLARDCAFWRGANYKFRLIDQSVPDNPSAALAFIRARVDGGPSVCRFCGLKDDAHEIQHGTQLYGLHLLCRRAWYRANRIAMNATRGTTAVSRSWWQVLELDRPNVSAVEIAAAYKRLAQKHHPDKGGDPEMMRAINEARDVATDKRTLRAAGHE
jgi:hypothetical protein